MNVKKGDTVKLLAGKDKGKEGVVTKVLIKEGKAVVEGLNLYKRHIKKSVNGGTAGQIIDFPAPIDASNLKVTSASKTASKKK